MNFCPPLCWPSGWAIKLAAGGGELASRLIPLGHLLGRKRAVENICPTLSRAAHLHLALFGLAVAKEARSTWRSGCVAGISSTRRRPASGPLISDFLDFPTHTNRATTMAPPVGLFFNAHSEQQQQVKRPLEEPASEE